MEREFEQCELKELLAIYMEASRSFSEALQRGDSSRELKMKRLKVQAISIHLNRKYKELNGLPDQRRRGGPPSQAE